MNPARNWLKTKVQALRVAAANPKGGVKVCPEGLSRIIEMANLAGDYELPAPRFPEFAAAAIRSIPFHELPDPVRLHLYEVGFNAAAWETAPEKLVQTYR